MPSASPRCTTMSITKPWNHTRTRHSQWQKHPACRVYETTQQTTIDIPATLPNCSSHRVGSYCVSTRTLFFFFFFLLKCNRRQVGGPNGPRHPIHSWCLYVPLAIKEIILLMRRFPPIDTRNSYCLLLISRMQIHATFCQLKPVPLFACPLSYSAWCWSTINTKESDFTRGIRVQERQRKAPLLHFYDATFRAAGPCDNHRTAWIRPSVFCSISRQNLSVPITMDHDWSTIRAGRPEYKG